MEALHQNPVKEKNPAINDLMQSVYHALETYSNVHRGSGQNSAVTTHLYEQARDIVLNYLNLNKTYTVIFATPDRVNQLSDLLAPADFKILSSADLGLNLGVRALAVKKKSLSKGFPFQSGGGTTRLYGKDWVIWDEAPDKFEPGTPAIVNIIAFAKALTQSKDAETTYRSNPESGTAVNEILYDELKDVSGKELLRMLRQNVIGKDLQVPTIKGLKKFINLDNSASTRTFIPVWNTFSKTLFQTDEFRKAIIEEVKSICAETLDAPEDKYDIIFTSNATESVNFIARNLPAEQGDKTKPVILNTILEHSSNDLPWRNVPGYSLIKMRVDKNGFYDLNELENILRTYNQTDQVSGKRIMLVAVNGASNVLGSCNDLNKISSIVHKYGAKLFIDAAQLIAHRKVNINKDDIDFLVFSAHKVYAPFGTGVLISKKGIMDISPAALENIKLSGEENVGGIAALGKSLELLNRIGFDTIKEEEQRLTAKTLIGLSKIPGIKIHGITEPDSPAFKDKVGVIGFELKGKAPGSVAKKLAAYRGIGVRYGCHCAHLILKYLLNFTPLQEKIQKFAVKLVPAIKLQGIVRASFGLENTESDADEFLLTMQEIADRTRRVEGERVEGVRKELSKKEYRKELKEYISAVSEKVYGKRK